jgi:hypothetical protein
VVSIFTGQTPNVTNAADSSTYSLGTKWFSSAAGAVTHGRWYFPDDPPTGSVSWVLYSLDGSELARATFGASAPGWQTVALSSPVAYTTPLTTWVAVVEVAGRYVATNGFFSGSAIVSGPLTAPADGDNGRVGVGSGYPGGSFADTCYFADVVFQPVGEVVDGALAATLPALTAAGTATLIDAGSVGTTTPPAGVHLSGGPTVTAALAGTLPALGVALAGPVGRPVVVRPDTGLVVRPSTGIVVRP